MVGVFSKHSLRNLKKVSHATLKSLELFYLLFSVKFIKYSKVSGEKTSAIAS